MGKMKELAMFMDELENAGKALVAAAEYFRSVYSFDEQAKAEAPVLKTGYEPPETEPVPVEEEDVPEKEAPQSEEPKKTMTKEEVRSILAAIAAKDGGKYKLQVKALVQKYGNGGSLTDVPEESYADLVDEVGDIV